MTDGVSDFFNEEIVEFPFKEEENRYGSRTIGVALKGIGATLPPPKLDPESLVIVKPEQYLESFDEHIEGELLVFKCRVHNSLLAKPDFYDCTKDPILFSFQVDSLAERNFPQRSFKGTFKAKIEKPPLKIRWQALNNTTRELTRYDENKYIELEPDGKSSFDLKVWVEEWNLANKKWEPKGDEYEFSHWLSPDDDVINLDVVSPVLLPDDPKLKGDAQAYTTWRSQVALPDVRLKEIPALPIDTVIRARAWHRHDITERLKYGVKAKRTHVAELDVPLRLTAKYELAVKFEPGTGRKYRGITFARKERFVADSFDKLTLVACARLKNRAPDEVNKQAEITLSLAPPDSKDYLLKVDPNFKEPGQVRATVSSAASIPYADGKTASSITLHVKGSLKYDKGFGQSLIALDPLDIPLDPRFPRLKIGWRVDPEKLLQGNMIVLPGDGKATFVLAVWLEIYDEDKSAWRRENPADYDFWIQINSTELPQEVFGHVKPPTVSSTGEVVTSWASKTKLEKLTALDVRVRARRVR